MIYLFMIFQESHVDPSLAEKQRMLKKARLADQLNDQISHRPGPLELIKKNILHTEETIETAVKSGVLAFKATSEGASGRPQHPSSYCGPVEEVSPSPSPPSTLSPASITGEAQHPAPGKERPKRPKQKPKQLPKSRLKFHEYKGPPNAQKASSPPGSVETPYELLLQQQKLLLQLHTGQLMLPASPAGSSAGSVASETSDTLAPPPPPLPPAPSISLAAARFEDMKVSDLRAECKRRNLRVSGPKPQLIDRLRPFLLEMQEEPPRSPASVASVASPESRAESEPSEDIVQSQRRLIEELERQLDESRQQLEAVRREATGAAASDQSRRLLQAHLSVTQLRAKLDALQHAPPPPPPPRYLLAAPDAAPDRFLRLFTVTSPPAATSDGCADAAPSKQANQAYILNGVKVVPIAIVPTAHYEPERAPPAPAAPPVTTAPPHHSAEDSQIMDDVLEILVQNGELPPSAVGNVTPNRSIDAGYLTAGSNEYTPTDIMGDDLLGETHLPDSLDGSILQRELSDVSHQLMNHTDLNHINSRCDVGHLSDIDADLNVDMLTNNEFHTNFVNSDSSPGNHDDLFDRLLAGDGDDSNNAMDIDVPERMSMTPLANGDLLDHTRVGFEDMNDLSLPPFHSEDTRHNTYDEQDYEFDFNNFELSPSMNVDSDTCDYMNTELIPNLFGRGHMPQCDPVLSGVLARPPRPSRKHY